MTTHTDVFDCLVVGAGPAGLTSAIYLARYRRHILVVDAGQSRAELIPITHNFPGFSDGISGSSLLKRLRAQAGRYDVRIQNGTVSALSKPNIHFIATMNGRRIAAKTVVLATGVSDKHPDIPDLRQATLKGLVRWCPICDGYEVIDQSIALLGPAHTAIAHALFLRTYTPGLTLFVTPRERRLSDSARRLLACARIPLIEDKIHDIRVQDGQVLIHTERNESHIFDSLYPMLGCDARAALATGLGAAVDQNGELIVDPHQHTTVPGLYAAGDVVHALNQMTVGVAHAAIAATAIHKQLPPKARGVLGSSK